RFMNRKLFKYVNIHPDKEKVIYAQLSALFKEASIDPYYYLAIDASSDLPYDVYHAGEGRVPIDLHMRSGEAKALSSHSVIVDALSGKKRADHNVYYL